MSVRQQPCRARVRAFLLAQLSLWAGLSCAPSPDPVAEAATLQSPAERQPATMPASLRAAYLQARQKEAGPEYRVQSRGAQVAADNAVHHLAVTLDAAGVHLQHAAAAGRGSLRLLRAGRAERPAPVAAVAPQGQGTRVQYLRPGLTEWYLNGPLGLEQGFTISRDAGCARLALELQVDGDLQAQLVGSGDQAHIALQDPTTGQRIYYSDLSAQDAQGRELDTRLLLFAQTIRLEVDVAQARYPIEIDPLLWSEQQKLTSSDGAAGDAFGYSVAMSGDTAVIGAYQKRLGVNAQQGQAYVYVRAGTTWTEQQKLTASDGAAGDRYGISVALSGDTVVVGAGQKKVGANVQQGQAYVYLRTGTVWTEQQKLTASDGAAGDRFGISVGLSGDTAVIGADQKKVGANLQQGQAYVYLRTGTVWAEQQKLIAADGAATDVFGYSVAISGNTALVGANQKKVGANLQQGQAYVYLRTGAVWAEQQKLIAADGASPDAFGIAVGISGDTAVIGAFNKKVGNNTSQGQAYVYARTGTVWTEQQRIIASDGAVNDNFGVSVAVSGNSAIVGASSKTVNGQVVQGQAYVYLRTGTNWTEQQKLVASDGTALDQFGISVALNADTAVVGAFQKAVSARALQGQAYVFLRTLLPNGTACALPGECASSFCVINICCDSACGSGICVTGQCRLLADLSIAVTGAPAHGVEPAAFLIQVNNLGPNAADSLSVQIGVPPAGVVLSAAGAGWTCTTQSALVVCTLPTAAPGAQAPIELQLRPPYNQTSITVGAQVSSLNPDPVPANNNAAVTIGNDEPVSPRLLGGGLAGCSAAGPPQAASPWALALLGGLALGLRGRVRRRRAQ